MSNKSEAKSVLSRRGKYTLEFKLEAVRLVKGGQDIAVTSEKGSASWVSANEAQSGGSTPRHRQASEYDDLLKPKTSFKPKSFTTS